MTESHFRRKFTITNEITTGLTAIERARGFLDAATLSEDWILEMGNRALVLEAHHTTHIEGTNLTLTQAERILAGETVVEADPDDALELLNYRRAFDFVSENLDGGAPVTEDLILEIHKHLVQGVRGGEGAPGRYREVQNYIIDRVTGQVVYTPPHASEVPRLMRELVLWLERETEIHPVLISGIAQFQLVHIHPFVDGNGRTSRLLSTLFLYRAGYDFKRLFTISEYYDRDRSEFYSAIQSVRDSGMDMTGWLQYFVQGLSTQLTEIKERGERVIRRDLMIREYGLTSRQSLALGHVLEHGRLAIQDYESLCPDANRRTLQRDLKYMVEKHLLVVEGATNQLIYRLVKSIL